MTNRHRQARLQGPGVFDVGSYAKGPVLEMGVVSASPIMTTRQESTDEERKAQLVVTFKKVSPREVAALR